MSYGSCFSGFGGLDIGLERAGWECRWFIEKNPYCQRVLARHWPNVPCYGDIQEIDPDVLEPVHLVAGGPPCQPISLARANERLAQDDPRWLWPAFFRVVRGVAPRYIVMENPTGILTAGFGDVLGELAGLGFDAEWSVLSACALGAPHSRERVFILAHPASERLEWSGFPSYPRPALLAGQGRSTSVGGYWASEPRPDGVAYGVPDRMERLQGHGNAVVPQVAEWVGHRLREHIETVAA